MEPFSHAVRNILCGRQEHKWRCLPSSLHTSRLPDTVIKNDCIHSSSIRLCIYCMIIWSHCFSFPPLCHPCVCVSPGGLAVDDQNRAETTSWSMDWYVIQQNSHVLYLNISHLWELYGSPTRSTYSYLRKQMQAHTCFVDVFFSCFCMKSHISRKTAKIFARSTFSNIKIFSSSTF